MMGMEKAAAGDRAKERRVRAEKREVEKKKTRGKNTQQLQCPKIFKKTAVIHFLGWWKNSQNSQCLFMDLMSQCSPVGYKTHRQA